MAELDVAPDRPTFVDRLKSAYDGWFNPGKPITATAPPGTPARQIDFSQAQNLNWMPRATEPIGFKQLRTFADNCYLVRVIIESMKDRMCTKAWHFRLKALPGEYEALTKERSSNDPRITQLTEFYQTPDSIHSWRKWLRMILEDRLVVDAATLEVQRTKDRRILNFLPIDGATVNVVIDSTGRRPQPPLTAYRQIIKGLPAVDFQADELLYMPANVRTHKLYGYSPVEQTIQLILLFIYKTVFHLDYYSDSDLPIAQIPYPADMNVDNAVRLIREIETRLRGNLEERSRMLPVPAGSEISVIKHEEFSSLFEEWAARVFCFVLGETPTGFIKQNNRATAQQADDSRMESGEEPIMSWVKDEIDAQVQRRDIFNASDIEFVWDERADTDPLKQAQIDQINVGIHKSTPNELRLRDGLSPLDGGDEFPAPATPFGKPEPNPDEDPGEEDTTPSPGGKKPPPKVANKAAGATPQKKTLKIDPGAFTEVRRAATDRIHATLKAFFFTERHRVSTIIGPQLGTVQKAAGDIPDLRVDEVMALIDMGVWDALASQIQADLEDTGRDAVAGVFATLNMDQEGSFFDLSNTYALEYAQARAAEMVGKKWVDGVLVDNPNARWAITQTTREDLRELIARAFAEKWTPAQLAENIDAAFTFSGGRAAMIAETETSLALTAATVNTGKGAGATLKSTQMSNLHDIDDECDDAEAAGEIGIDDFFPDGSLHVPLHPLCHCVELLHIGKEDADETGSD
jgi:hypothetical protein